MNRSLLLLLCLVFLGIHCLFAIKSAPLCRQGSTFPDWMMGNFHAQFADGSSANGSFGLWYANVTFSTGEYGILTMTEPLRQGDGFYVFHECVHIHGMDPAHRCSLLVRNDDDGYTEYIHTDPRLVPKCPESLTTPGLETEIVRRIK